MKTFISLFSMILMTASAFSQQPIHKQKIQGLINWVGTWKGEGRMITQTGESKKSAVVENIQMQLDSTLLVIEGKGTSTDVQTKRDVVTHHAFAILSFDPGSNQYKMKSYLTDGKSTDAWFNQVTENNYQWGFDSPMGKVRYTVKLDPIKQTWDESGEFSRDGASWRKFFEMNLTKSK